MIGELLLQLAVHSLTTTETYLFTGYDVKNTNENAYWWVDAQFLHHQDDQVVVSIGGYIERPGLVPVLLDSRIRGLIYTLQFAERLREWNIK